MVLIVFSTVGLMLSLPALWSLHLIIILQTDKPDQFGLYSFLLVPAFAVLLTAAYVGWLIHRNSDAERTRLWFAAYALLILAAALWLVPAALLGPLWLMVYVLEGSNLG